MPLTRGARHRLPAGEFRDDDLVIDLPQPHSTNFNVSTLTTFEPSKADDETRYQRFRKHLEQQHGPGKIKTKGKDDFMPLEEGQILVDRVYAYYEVNHWPGAEKQFKKSKIILAQLRGEKSKSSDSNSDNDTFDDEEADKTFAIEDESPIPPTSAARTIDDDHEDEIPILQRTPASAVLRRTNSQNWAPALGDFTPAQIRQQRLQSQKDVKIRRTSNTSQDREYHNSDPSLHRSGGPPLDTQILPSQPPNSAALTVLARLDQRRQEDIDNGFVSPNTHRQYTKQERMLVVGPEIMNERRQSWPRNMLKKKRSRPDGDEGNEYEDEKSGKKVVKKPKQKRGSSQSTNRLDQPHQQAVSPTPVPRLPSQQQPAEISRAAIYPKLPFGILANSSNVWPVVCENQSRLAAEYQVRIQYINDASTVLSTYIKTQGAGVTAAVIRIEESLTYRLLMTEEGRASGWEECRVRARKAIWARLEAFETQWTAVSKDAGMRFTAPDPDTRPRNGGKGFYTNPRGKKAVKVMTGKQSGSDETRKEERSSTQLNVSAAPQHRLAPIPTSANINPKPEPNFSTRPLFLSTVTRITSLQACYLLETIRFQTAIPSALRLSRSSDSDLGGVSAQRRQYESNMRLGALSWQAHFFGSWAIKAERSVGTDIKGGGLRFWKLECLSQDGGHTSGEEEKWLAVDFLTGLKGIVDDQWTPPDPRVYSEQEMNKISEIAERGKKEIASTTGRTYKANLQQFLWEKMLKSAQSGNPTVKYQQDGDSQSLSSLAAVQQVQESDRAAEHEHQRRLKTQAGMQVPTDRGFKQYPSMGSMERHQYEMMLQREFEAEFNMGPSLPPQRVLSYEYVDPRLLTRPYSMPTQGQTGIGTQMGTRRSNYGLGKVPIDPALQVTNPFHFKKHQQPQGSQQYGQQDPQQRQAYHSYPPADPRFNLGPPSHLSQYFMQQYQQPQPAQQPPYLFLSGSGYPSRPGFGSDFGYEPQSDIDPSLLSNINRPTNLTSYLPSGLDHYDSNSKFPVRVSTTRPAALEDNTNEYMGPSPPISPTTLLAPHITKEDKGKSKATGIDISDIIAGLKEDVEVELDLNLNQTPHDTALEEGFDTAAPSKDAGHGGHGGHPHLHDHSLNEVEIEKSGTLFKFSPSRPVPRVTATREESFSPKTVRNSGLVDVFSVDNTATRSSNTPATETTSTGVESVERHVDDEDKKAATTDDLVDNENSAIPGTPQRPRPHSD